MGSDGASLEGKVICEYCSGCGFPVVWDSSVPQSGNELCRPDLGDACRMTPNVIVVENLSKSYLLGHRSSSNEKNRHATFREVIGREERDFARKAVDLAPGRHIVQA